MTQWTLMLSTVVGLFAVIAAGGFARRINWLTHEADQSLIKLTVNLLFPALIFQRIFESQLLAQRSPWQLALPPIAGAATVLAGFALALALARLLGRRAGLDDAPRQHTFALCVGIYNYAYLPLPLMDSLFGRSNPFTIELQALLFVFNLGIELAMWTVGIVLVSGHFGRQWYKRLLSVPTVSILVAIILKFARVDQLAPDWVMLALRMMGEAAIPLALVLIGATIADYLGEGPILRGWRQGLPRWRENLHHARVIALAGALRLGALPALFLALAWMLPASRELKIILVFQAAMPSAVFPIILARHYGGHPPTAVRVVLGTSLLSLATMPAWLAIGWWLLNLNQ